MRQESKELFTSLIAELERLPQSPVMDKEAIMAAIDKLFSTISGKYTDDDFLLLNLKTVSSHYINDQNLGFAGLIELMKSRLHVTGLRELEQREATDEFDAKYGTTTGISIEQFEMPENVSLERALNCGRHDPTPSKAMQLSLSALAGLGVNYSDFVFIDVGCGLGRNLLLASTYSFKRIIGIEISKFLTQVCLKNIDLFSRHVPKAGEIEVKCLNALDFVFPAESLVLYFYNPFPKAVSDQFISNLLEFHQRHPVKIYLIFLGFAFPAVENSKVFELITVVPTNETIHGERTFTLPIFASSNR